MFDRKKLIIINFGGNIYLLCLHPYNLNFWYLNKISSPYDFEFTRFDCTLLDILSKMFVIQSDVALHLQVH